MKVDITISVVGDDGHRSVIQVEGCGAIIGVVDSLPGMPKWTEARDSDPSTMPAPTCLLMGTEQAIILALAVSINACRGRVGEVGVQAALKIASDMSSDSQYTMLDGAFERDERRTD